MIGKKFNRLLVLKDSGERDSSRRIYWLCQCDCGNLTKIIGSSIITGHTKSCGCLLSETTKIRMTKHGHTTIDSKSPTYISWEHMIQRCTNSNSDNYKYYGGRGIKVCKKWRDSFICFLKDMGERPANKTLDRINTNGDYERRNCRWATQKEQIKNRRN